MSDVSNAWHAACLNEMARIIYTLYKEGYIASSRCPEAQFIFDDGCGNVYPVNDVVNA